MRTFLAIVAGCFVELITFSIPWALWVLPHPNDESRISEFFGVVLGLGIYLLPISFAFALLFVWPALLFASTKEWLVRFSVSALGWLFVSTAYVGTIATTNPEVRIPALWCGLFASAVTTIVFMRIMWKRQKEKPTHATG